MKIDLTNIKNMTRAEKLKAIEEYQNRIKIITEMLSELNYNYVNFVFSLYGQDLRDERSDKI